MPALRTWGLRVALVLAGALAGGLAQRYCGTPRVEVHTETRDVVHEVVKEVVKVEVREVAAKAETRVVYRDRVVSPDGTRRETEVERSETADLRLRDTQAAAQLDHALDATHENTTTTTPVGPDWRVALMFGASVREPLLPVAGPLVLGLEVDYRIAGPVWGGVWASTYGAAGLSLSLSF